ncbi:MAG: Fe-S cluster assembly protein SufD [Chlorobi bacterium]|nr:Fe-S cluster assembly protein SufD [Chlorobiota bacterium]
MKDTKNENIIFADLYKNETDFLIKETEKKKYVEEFLKSKIPDGKKENWRKFNSKPIFRHKYKLGKKAELDFNTIKSMSFFNPDANRIVLINGFFNEKLSFRKNEEIILTSTKKAKIEYPEIFYSHFRKIKNNDKTFFDALNESFSQDGAFIFVPDNISVKEPIHILHFIISSNGNIFSQTENIIIAGKNSSLKIIHSYHSLSRDFSFNNGRTDIFAGKNSATEYYIFEGEGDTAAHINNINTEQEKNSYLKSNIVTFCGSTVRNNFKIKLNEEHAKTEIEGIYMPDKEQYIDNFVEISHLKSNCESKQLFKGVIDNRAISVFTGKVYVAPGAQKTNSEQSNKNLLLTDYAKAYSRPQLEIYADDVACSHGSTTGQLDDEALFYMRTRGIPEKQAKTMLTSAFLKDIIENISTESYKDYVNFLINGRLKGQNPETLCSVKLCPSCT